MPLVSEFKENNLCGTYVSILDVFDRQDTNRKLGSVLVEREDVCTRIDGVVDKASITLSFRLVGCTPRHGSTESGQFKAQYSQHKNSVSLTSGAIFMDLFSLQGHRVGTYLLHVIVQWAKQWKGATVESVSLEKGQAYDSNRIRRNRFYEAAGLTFDYDDDDSMSGISREISVEELIVTDSWGKNISEKSVLEILDDMKKLELSLDMVKFQIRQARYREESIENNYISWAISVFWSKNYINLTKLTITLMIAISLFISIKKYI